MPHYRYRDGAPRVVAHSGMGEIFAERVHERNVDSSINFVDLIAVPPGTSIGRHRHARNDEEIYIVIDGTATMLIDGEEREIGAGDVLLNPPGGIHGLVNSGTRDIRIVVVDVSIDGSAYVLPEDLT